MVRAEVTCIEEVGCNFECAHVRNTVFVNDFAYDRIVVDINLTIHIIV